MEWTDIIFPSCALNSSVLILLEINISKDCVFCRQVNYTQIYL